MQDVTRVMRVVRLGQGVDKTGRLDETALARTLEAARDYAALCEEHGVESIRFVATSATRDAENRQDFVNGIEAALGLAPEVVSGQEEAALGFRGALSVLRKDVARPVVVVDIGGGSSEIVLGDDEGPWASHSMNVGCVRVTERHLAGDPPTAAQIEAARADVRAALDVALRDVPVGRARTLVGLAGSVTTVTACALGLREYSSDAIDGAILPVTEVWEASEGLLRVSRAERESHGFMHPGRIDVIGGGALVWQEIIRRVSQEIGADGGELTKVVTSEHDILDGIALSQL